MRNPFSFQDLKYAARSFGRTPGFTLAVVVSIALGIAANSTVFTLVNGLLLGELPVREPSRLVMLNGGNSMSEPDFRDYREQGKSVFEDVTASFPVIPASIGGNGEPERVWGQSVAGNYFGLIGVPMTLGRGILPSEDLVPGRDPVVVLSHSLWQRRFGADRSILGRQVVLNGLPYTVAGVAARGFVGTFRGLTCEFWVPLAMTSQIMPDLSRDLKKDSRNSSWLSVDARLKPGVTREQATAAVNVIKDRLDKAYRPNEKRREAMQLIQTGGLVRELRKFAVGLTGMLGVVVILVLLIACANVANLLLARSAARQKEIGIRLAIGASRGRLIRQLLTESIVLSMGGAVIGFALAYAAGRAISSFELPLPLPVGFNFVPDMRVMLFTAGLAVLTGIIFGFAPALKATRPDLVVTLKDQGGNFGTLRRFGLRNGLVVVQVALSLVLLVGATLFLRSLHSASTIDLGMKPDGILMMAFDPKLNRYTPERTRELLSNVRQRVEALPGVQLVSYVDTLPLSLGGSASSYRVASGGKETEINGHVYRVGSGYFDALGIRRLGGRDFTARDDGKVAIVNEAFARKAFGNENPIGQTLLSYDRKTRFEIIGLTATAKSRTLGEDPAACIYFSLEGDPDKVISLFGTSLMVKTQVPPRNLLRAVREQIGRLDSNLAVYNVETMREHVEKSLLVPRLCALLLAIFGGVGLVLASVGLYGVMSYSVRSRIREIGIRMALGAPSQGVLAMVTRQGMLLAGVGLTIGLALAWVLTQFAASLLYGVSPKDAFTFVAVPAVLAVIALVAVVLPARRASRVDPLHALRYE